MYRILLLTFISFYFLIGCNTESQKDQYYQLVVLYENHACGFQQQGIYLTNNGELFSFINNETMTDNKGILEGKSYSEIYLNSLLTSSSQLLEAIDKTVLQRLATKIEKVENTNISESTYTCADAGKLSFIIFEYNPTSGVYSPIILEQRGDIASANLSEDAKTIVDWLDSKLKEYQIVILDGCESPFKS